MDVDLVVRAQRGDADAFTRLASDATPRFLGIAHRILRDIDVAEDATQRALLSMWRRLPTLHEPERFEAWAYRILIRACYDEGRAARRWDPAVSLLPADDAEEVDPFGAVIDRDQLERAFRRLSLDHRAVVVLRHYRHMSIEEVADALAIPAGTAASRLHYALRALRSAVEADARPGREVIVS
jgi:RNA polymerase sigma-70 factor (ECF subfamily)